MGAATGTGAGTAIARARRVASTIKIYTEIVEFNITGTMTYIAINILTSFNMIMMGDFSTCRLQTTYRIKLHLLFGLCLSFYITASPERQLYYDIIAGNIIIVISSANSGDTQ